MNLSTLRKLVLGYIAAMPILIVITIVQFMSVQGVVDAYRREGKSYDIIRQSDALAAMLTETDVSIRNFIRTRKSADLEPYQAAPTRTREVLDSLEKLTQGDEPQQTRVKQAGAAIATRLQLYSKQLETQPVKLVRPSPRAEPPAPNEAEVQGEKTSAEIVKVLADLRRYESDRLPSYAAVSRAKVTRANRLAPIAGVLAIWMVLLAALLLYRDTARRAYAGVERRMQTRIVEKLPLGVCLVDEDGLVLYTNAAQDELFAYEPGGIVGRHIAALHATPRGDGDDFFERARQEIRSQGAWRGDFLARQKNSSTFKCLSQAIPLDISGTMYRLFLMAGGGAPPEVETAPEGGASPPA